MKAILYIGAVLMTGVSVYGFVDYNRSKQKMSSLYETKKAETTTEKPQVAEEKQLPEKPADIVIPEVNATTEEAGIKENNTKKNGSKVKKTNPVKKKKVLSYKMYSRAPLDDKYLEKEEKSNTEKKKN